MEISVERDKRTGKSQVVSTATITPETIQDKGLKVYDDGHKSVYALNPDGGKMLNGAVGEMTPTELEELLLQATDKNFPTEVQYHQPVYSIPYTGSSRSSTPRTPNKTQWQTPTPGSSPFLGDISLRNQFCREEKPRSHYPEGWKKQSKTPSPNLNQQDSTSRVQTPVEETKRNYSHIQGQFSSDRHLIPQPLFGTKTPCGLTNSKTDVNTPKPAALLSVKAQSEGMPAPIQPIHRAVERQSISLASHNSEVYPDALTESMNLVNTLPEELQSEPVTMIFMGYENAEDEEKEDIQAELVIIGNSDDNDDDEALYVTKESDMGECLSYHPEGYKSKVFQPKAGIAKVTGCRDIIEDTYTNWDELGLHKPTFIHKPGKHSL